MQLFLSESVLSSFFTKLCEQISKSPANGFVSIFVFLTCFPDPWTRDNWYTKPNIDISGRGDLDGHVKNPYTSFIEKSDITEPEEPFLRRNFYKCDEFIEISVDTSFYHRIRTIPSIPQWTVRDFCEICKQIPDSLVKVLHFDVFQVSPLLTCFLGYACAFGFCDAQ